MRGALVGLVAYGAACLLCLIPLNFVLAGAYLVFTGGTGIAFIDSVMHPARAGPPGAFFFASILVWAGATGYSAWLLLERHPPIWMPRLLGVLIYPPLAAHFLRAGHAWQALAVATIAAAWLACIVTWRRAFEDAAPSSEEPDAPGTGMLLALLAALTLLHAPLVGVMLSNIALPRFAGMAPIVLLVFASWTLIGSLVYALLPKSYRLA